MKHFCVIQQMAIWLKYTAVLPDLFWATNLNKTFFGHNTSSVAQALMRLCQCQVASLVPDVSLLYSLFVQKNFV